MKTVILDGEYLSVREGAHTYLRERLELPEYYGENMDALYDCLTEMSATEIHIYVGQERSAYLQRILYVFHQAAEENEHITLYVELKEE